MIHDKEQRYVDFVVKNLAVLDTHWISALNFFDFNFLTSKLKQDLQFLHNAGPK